MVRYTSKELVCNVTNPSLLLHDYSNPDPMYEVETWFLSWGRLRYPTSNPSSYPNTNWFPTYLWPPFFTLWGSIWYYNPETTVTCRWVSFTSLSLLFSFLWSPQYPSSLLHLLSKRSCQRPKIPLETLTKTLCRTPTQPIWVTETDRLRVYRQLQDGVTNLIWLVLQVYIPVSLPFFGSRNHCRKSPT